MKLSTEGCQRLVSAIITTAIEDLSLMRKAGWISGDKVNHQTLDQIIQEERRIGRRRKLRQYQARKEVVTELLYFFRAGGQMDQLIDAAAIRIDPDSIRSKLQL